MIRPLASYLKLFRERPVYIIYALVAGTIFYQLVFWSLNLGLASYLLTTPYLTPLDKLWLVWNSFIGGLTPPISGLGLTLVIVSILQAVAIAGLIYSLRVNRRLASSKRALGGVGVAGALSVLGLGCATCGTSIIAPIIAMFVTSGSVGLTEQIGNFSAGLALVLTLVTVYLVGQKLNISLQLDPEAVSLSNSGPEPVAKQVD